MTALTLENLGYRVTALSDSKQALDRLLAEPEAFDLLITDQTMPEVTGEELAKHARNIRGDLPVIICSGYSDIMDDIQDATHGIDHFLMKPVQRTTLAQTIRTALDETKQKN